MAVYTPPHTPSSYLNPPMNPTLPPLPIELLSTWSTWRPPKLETPITPPQSAPSQRRAVPPTDHAQPTLPPISHFDRQVSRLSPITPPQDDASQWYTYGPPDLKLPPVLPHCPPPSVCPPLEIEQYIPEPRQPSPPSHPQIGDWFSPSTQRSSQFIAEKTCEMVCYLWFSTLSQTSSPSKRSRHLHHPPSYIPEFNHDTAYLQFAVSPSFVRFMQKVLETTQVSQSVIVLSLHYIYRLKLRNRFTNGHAGSEYRVAVAALMTNKTWSEVSGIELAEVNKMEREFLLGIDFDLYVDKTTYESWLNLLKGLVMTKEKDSQQWQRSRYGGRVTSRVRLSVRPSQVPSRHRTPSSRARSSSPSRNTVSFPFSTPPKPAAPQEFVQVPRSGSKRSASDAFSPTSASFPPIKPSKRPMALTLDIPDLVQSSGSSSSSSVSPLEPLQSFSKLSIAASPAGTHPGSQGCSPAWPSSTRQDQVPQTLVSAYRMDDKRSYPTPQNLYFYALAGSPMHQDGERPRKAHLRYHQPPAPIRQYPSRPSVPLVVQSACASPHDAHSTLPPVTMLPQFTDRAWSRTQAVLPQPPYHSPYHQTHPGMHVAVDDSVPSAPFANAGPPGVQFYYNNSMQPQRMSPEYYWSRGRRP